MTPLEWQLHLRLRYHCMEYGINRVRCFECMTQWLGLKLENEQHRDECLAKPLPQSDERIDAGQLYDGEVLVRTQP